MTLIPAHRLDRHDLAILGHDLAQTVALEHEDGRSAVHRSLAIHGEAIPDEDAEELLTAAVDE